MRIAALFTLDLLTGLVVVAGYFGYNQYRAADALRPANANTVWLQNMTWPEVRQAVRAGATTVIVPFGGTEQGGLHLVLDKHNQVIAAAVEQAARTLGKVLVAPVMPYTPEGNFAPPGGNMAWPGTLGLRPATFVAVAEDLATSLKLHGFKLILFVADHGLSLDPLDELAKRLDRAWRSDGIRVVHVAAYYDGNGQVDWLRQQGFRDGQIGNHAGIRDTSELLWLYPNGVRQDRRLGRSPQFGENIGTNGDPSLATAALGRKMLALKVRILVAAVRKLRPKTTQ